MAERQIISGDAGTTWTNDTEKVYYQFVCSLINTCGFCLQYHLKIAKPGRSRCTSKCRCSAVQRSTPGQKAPEAVRDYRKLLDGMSPADQAAAIGASNYRLLKSGLATWEDIVTPNRVRDFREVVARKRLTVDTMVKHGVKRYQAEKAYSAVHTEEHQHVERQRAELLNNLTAAGVSQENLVGELSKRLAARVTVAAGPTGAQVGRPQDGTAPAWAGGKLPGVGPSSAGELAKLISGWKPKGPPSQAATAESGAGCDARTETANRRRAPIEEPAVDSTRRNGAVGRRASASAGAGPAAEANRGVAAERIKKERKPSKRAFTQHKLGQTKAKVTFEHGALAKAKEMFGEKLSRRDKSLATSGARDEVRRSYDPTKPIETELRSELWITHRRRSLVWAARSGRRAMARSIIRSTTSSNKDIESYQAHSGEDTATSLSMHLPARSTLTRSASPTSNSAYRVRGDFRRAVELASSPRTGQPKERWAGYYVWPRYGYEDVRSADESGNDPSSTLRIT